MFVCMRCVVSHFFGFLFSLVLSMLGKLQNVKCVSCWNARNMNVVCKCIVDFRFANAFMMYLFGLNTSEVGFFCSWYAILYGCHCCCDCFLGLFICHCCFFPSSSCLLFVHTYPVRALYRVKYVIPLSYCNDLLCVFAYTGYVLHENARKVGNNLLN